MIMTPEVKRRLRLRQLTNDSLFPLYDNEIVLRLHNAKNLRDTRRMLLLFRKYLNDYPPSARVKPKSQHVKQLEIIVKEAS